MIDFASPRRLALGVTALVSVFAIAATGADMSGPVDQGPRLPARQDGDATLGK